MAASNDHVALCLLFWMLIYRVNDSLLIEGWKCPILRHSGDITINHSSETQDTCWPGNYSLGDHLPICVCGMCEERRPRGWPILHWQFLVLLGGERHHFKTNKNTLILQEISANQNLNGT